MKEPTLLIIPLADLRKLDLLKTTEWGAVADLDSITSREELNDIGVEAYCDNLDEL